MPYSIRLSNSFSFPPAAYDSRTRSGFQDLELEVELPFIWLLPTGKPTPDGMLNHAFRFMVGGGIGS